MGSPTLSRAEPATVHESLGRHYLTDGLDIVFDLCGSNGSWLRDAKSGRDYLDGLRGLEADLPGRISNARGRGLMIAFDVESRDVETAVVTRAFERGLLLLGCGERSVRFRPALTLSREDADRGLDILRQTLKSL